LVSKEQAPTKNIILKKIWEETVPEHLIKKTLPHWLQLLKIKNTFFSG
jgi:hypothetical protein